MPERYTVKKYGEQYAAFDTVARERDSHGGYRRDRVLARAAELNRIAALPAPTGSLDAARSLALALEMLDFAVRARNLVNRDWNSLEVLADRTATDLTLPTADWFEQFASVDRFITMQLTKLHQPLQDALGLLLMAVEAHHTEWHPLLDTDGPAAARVRYCVFPGAARADQGLREAERCPRDLLLVAYTGGDAAEQMHRALATVAASGRLSSFLNDLLPVRLFVSDSDGKGYPPHRALATAEKVGQVVEHTWARNRAALG